MKLSKMAKSVVIFSCLLLAFGFYPERTMARERYEEKFEKTVDLAKDGKVFLSNVSGDIVVKTWGEEQVKIDALKVCEASSLSRAQEDSKKVSIEVNKEGNVLRIETKYPEHRRIWGESSGVAVHYRLMIPKKASIEIKSVSGDIQAEGIGGSIKVGAVSGNVDVMKADKGADCNTVSGDMKLQNITGDVYLKDVSGSITLGQIRGSIEAETISGDIELRDVSEAKVVNIKALSGEITYQGKINLEGRYTFKSHSGDIEIILPSDSAFEFEAETFSGDIESDFQIEVSGKISPRELRGIVNKGGAFVRLTTFSGNINLKKS